MGRRDHPGLTGRTDRVRLRRRSARLIRAERLGRSAAPAAAIALAYLTCALFGLATPWLFAACLAAAGLALAAGTVRCRWPSPAEIDRRVETAAALPHRPFAALADQPAATDPLALALWHAHQRRAATSLATARLGWPVPSAARRDPWALRGLLLLLLLTAGVTAGPYAQSRLDSAFTLPPWPFPGPQLDVWITPPDYVDAPPLLLAPGGAVRALAGSRLTVLVNGPSRLPGLSLPGARFNRATLGPNSHRADATLTTSGRLNIGPWWHRRATYRLTVVPPAAPRLTFRQIEIGADGRLTLAWHADDPYGLTSLTARIAPIDAPGALPQDFALPVATGDGTARLDLTADPLAGLPSRLTFTAGNRAGVATTLTPSLAFTPPPPELHDPTAQKLFARRQRLALNPAQAISIGLGLRQLAAAPASAITASADFQLANLAAALAGRATTPADAVRRLYLLIREIEAGPDFQPGQALAQADQALLRALQRGAGPAELQKLLARMHQALARHLAALAPQSAAAGHPLDLAAIDRLAQQMAADQAAGRTAQAAQDLRQLQKILAALQSARPLSAAQAARAQAAAAAAQALARLTTGEADLRDATDRGTAMPSDQASLAASLNATRRALAAAQLPTAGLDQAAQAMAAAQAALAQDDGAGAEAAETAAIQNLQKAGAALAAASQPAFALGQSGTPEGAGQDGINGVPNEDSSGFGLPPDNPADAIQRQIIREDGAPDLPPPTHQYLHRLLNPDGP